MFFRSKYSLNAISHDTAIGLIRRALADGVNLTEVNSINVELLNIHDMMYFSCSSNSSFFLFVYE